MNIQNCLKCNEPMDDVYIAKCVECGKKTNQFIDFYDSIRLKTPPESRCDCSGKFEWSPNTDLCYDCQLISLLK